MLLRPDPLLTARQLALPTVNVAGTTADVDHEPRQSLRRGPVAWWQASRPIVLAASGMVLAQAVMVAVMTMTPVHLESHHHGLDAVGLIIGLHIGAMYLPSPITGRLVDRFTPSAVTAGGGAVLVSAALVAATAGASTVTLGVALMLLGLGWNLSLVGGTALVTNLTTLENRARTQGSVDVAWPLPAPPAGSPAERSWPRAASRPSEWVAAGLAAMVVVSAKPGPTNRNSARLNIVPCPAVSTVGFPTGRLHAQPSTNPGPHRRRRALLRP